MPIRKPFDPDEVAYYEKAGWEAYYDRRWLRVLRLMVQALTSLHAALFDAAPAAMRPWPSCAPRPPWPWSASPAAIRPTSPRTGGKWRPAATGVPFGAAGHAASQRSKK